jgi:hypothetical protein
VFGSVKIARRKKQGRLLRIWKWGATGDLRNSRLKENAYLPSNGLGKALKDEELPMVFDEFYRGTNSERDSKVVLGWAL